MKRIFYEIVGAAKVLTLIIIFCIGGIIGIKLQKDEEERSRANKEFTRRYSYSDMKKQK